LLESSKKIWFYVISLFFVLANAVLLYNERFELLGFPVLILLAYLALFKLDVLYYIVIFLVPLSINLDDMGVDLGVGIALPTEPLIVGMMLIFILKLFYDGKFDRKVLSHPISVLLLLQLAWIVMTTIASSNPLISVKFLLSRLWFVSVFYFLASQFLKTEKNQRQMFWLYVLGFVPVLLYTFVEHSMRGFSQSSANWVMNPFFNDHTSYGACLAMVFPFLLWQSFSPKITGAKRIIVISLMLLFVLSITLSYTRAAWVSLIGALGVFVVLKFKIKSWVIWAGVILIGGFLTLKMDDILEDLSRNKQDSSSNLSEHIESISNVSSDASNLERLNRWKSAWGMFSDRPVFGYGPGTYAFEYAPYQRSKDKTIISTNAGDGGNAHSEYLGPLSEQGALGTVFMLGFIFVVCRTAVRVYKSNLAKESRMIGLTAFMGLITYYLHGILNNFLDTDKASALFWGFSVIILILDNKAKDLDDKKLLLKSNPNN
jgi:putative inorganic carbon (HCO3(-)) transporter|tara:strand:- start:14054 stop:15514 length:1461 start_codon:yes stop_codon:yes gene_type:complete